jgi:hypothetical protein
LRETQSIGKSGKFNPTIHTHRASLLFASQMPFDEKEIR